MTTKITASVFSESVNPVTSFKNRIINGNMVIDQRNAGASVTPTTGQFLVDRYRTSLSQPSKYSAQQNAGGITAPAGFTNYLGFTSLSAYSILASDFFSFVQPIEGLNFSDLAWGTASAAPVTLSFWVRSSLTGTFGGAFQNADLSRSYPFTFAIGASGTWEYKTITILGDTAGTWLTTNGIGLQVRFSLGTGSDRTGPANTWATANYNAPNSAVSIVGTNAATFYITGIQLEKGSTATSFDYRPYGTELMLCQRYFANLLAAGTDYNIGVTRDSSTATQFVLYAPVTMRATPTLGVPSGFGRIVAYDTGFGITVNAVTSMVLLFTANNRILNIFTGTASYGGQYVYSAYDTIGATTAMTISSEL